MLIYSRVMRFICFLGGKNLKLSAQTLNQLRLTMAGLLLLLVAAACGEMPTATPVPSTQAATTTAAATTNATTSATTNAATTAARTTTPPAGGTIAAGSPAVQTVFATPTGRRPRVTPDPKQPTPPPLQELFNLVPDTGLPLLVFNNYKAFREANGISADLKFADIAKNPSLLGSVSLETFLLHFTPSPITPFDKVAKGTTLPGYDLWEIDQEASSFISPTTLVVAKGRMNQGNMIKALLDAKAQFQDWKGYDYFISDKKANNPIQKQLGEAFDQVMFMPERQIFNAAGEYPPVQVSTDVLTKDAFLRGVILNPRIAALIGSYGITPTALLASQDFNPAPAFSDASLDPKLSADDRKKQLDIITKGKLLKPYMGAYGYVEQKGGVGTYYMSVYYDKPEDAKQTAPVLEALVRYGVAPSSKTPLSDYYEFVSSSVQENVITFKLNSKPNKSLNKLYFQKDLPIFWKQ